MGKESIKFYDKEAHYLAPIPTSVVCFVLFFGCNIFTVGNKGNTFLSLGSFVYRLL